MDLNLHCYFAMLGNFDIIVGSIFEKLCTLNLKRLTAHNSTQGTLYTTHRVHCTQHTGYTVHSTQGTLYTAHRVHCTQLAKGLYGLLFTEAPWYHTTYMHMFKRTCWVPLAPPPPSFPPLSLLNTCKLNYKPICQIAPNSGLILQTYDHDIHVTLIKKRHTWWSTKHHVRWLTYFVVLKQHHHHHRHHHHHHPHHSYQAHHHNQCHHLR